MKKILCLILLLSAYSGFLHSDITWSSPVSISTPSVNAVDPHVVIDSNGNATALWVENNIIISASLPFGGSWSSQVTLSNVSNTSSSPKLGIDSSGNVTALWIENAIIKTATLPFGGSWSSATVVSGSGVSKISFDVDSAGNAVSVWVRTGNIEAATRTSGTWSLVSVLSVLSSSNPQVKISSNGKAMAVWKSISGTSDVIVSDQLTISTNTWAATKNVTTGTAAFANYPKIAIDSQGNATAAWFRYNFLGGAYSNVQVFSSTLTNGAATWSVPSILSNGGIGNPANLAIRLKADINGDVLAVWTNLYDGMTYSIESTNKIFGGVWPQSIAPQATSLYSFGLDVAISQGTAVLVNMAWDGVSDIFIQSQETDSTNPLLQGWTNSNVFSTGSDNGYPACDITVSSTSLTAVAVWTNYNGTNTTINASQGTDSVISPPTAVSASQSSTNFGVYTDYQNTITWGASSDPNIIQYNIYRNGEFFASTLPGTLTFTDHNQVQSGTVTYGVAALDLNLRQSAMVTFTLF